MFADRLDTGGLQFAAEPVHRVAAGRHHGRGRGPAGQARKGREEDRLVARGAQAGPGQGGRLLSVTLGVADEDAAAADVGACREQARLDALIGKASRDVGINWSPRRCVCLLRKLASAAGDAALTWERRSEDDAAEGRVAAA